MSRRRCIPPGTLAIQVLNALEDASELYDGQMWLGFNQRDWRLGRILKELSSSNDLETDSIARLVRGQVEFEYIIKLLHALTSSATDLLEACRKRLRSSSAMSKLSNGFASLPDEILSLICKFASHHEQEGTRHAIWLSQVSRRFRRVVIGDRSLWTTHFLWYNTTKKNIERCIGRAADDSDLHLVVNSNTTTMGWNSFGVRAFLDVCAPFMSRWRTLTFSGDWVIPEDDISTIGGLLGIMTFGESWILPRLREVNFSQRHYDERLGGLSWYSCGRGFFSSFTCNAPNLRVLRCSQFIPPPDFPFKSITRFAVTLTLIQSKLKQQLEELLISFCEMRNIAEIDLELDVYDNGNNRILKDDVEIDYVFNCEAVKSFRLKVSEFSLPTEAQLLLGPFMEALHMPLLEHLTLAIDLRYADVYYYGLGEEDDQLIPEVMGSLIPDPDFHPNLSSLSIDLPIPDLLVKEGWSWRRKNRMQLTIPLDELPQLSILIVSTFCDISFSRGNDSDEESSADRVEKCSLRELRLVGCKILDTKSLEEMVRSLKEVDAWDTLDCIDIENCEGLDYKSAVEVVGRERLRCAGR